MIRHTHWLVRAITRLMTITTITDAYNVGILGSGISGATAARTLADAGVQVKVFECGYGVGGRTSTRITTTVDDDNRFAFDHGAQYISQPKSSEFQQAMDAWQRQGFVQEWKGRFASVNINSSEDSHLWRMHPETVPKLHYVGYPHMSSICQNLLNHENISIVCQSRACAAWDKNHKKWILSAHGNGKALGSFDWLVASDRLSASNNRADLREAGVVRFQSHVESIKSVPILALLVVLESSLKEVPFDGVLFGDSGDNGDNGDNGDSSSSSSSSLGWIARDTSKPGRDRSDGQECWVIQSNPQAATCLLESIPETMDFEQRRALVREKTQDILWKEFYDFMVPKFIAPGRFPKASYKVGHRWSAAFPKLPNNDPAISAMDDDIYHDWDQQFVACGDYMGQYTGRVEGAYLSGLEAAKTILNV